MFGFSKKEKEEERTKEILMPEWNDEMMDLETRWFTFLDKLEERMDELCEAAVPELESAYRTDTDQYKRVHYRLLLGIQGQLSNMHDKAYAMENEKIYTFYDRISDSIGSGKNSLKLDKIIDGFRKRCTKRFEKFEKKEDKWRKKLEKTAEQNDLELEYKKILDEYENNKDKFTCKQCGSPISVSKIFFLTTYITCPSCETQNTFEPSSAARNLDDLARSLAEYRTKHLLKTYKKAKKKIDKLYHQIHSKEISIILEKDKEVLQKFTVAIEVLNKERNELINTAPLMYEQYLRAMFDEWHKIIPDLKEQNEKLYERMLSEYSGV